MTLSRKCTHAERYSHPHENPIDHPWRDVGQAIRRARNRAEALELSADQSDTIRADLHSILWDVPALQRHLKHMEHET
jgi:hypothetical protein